MKKIAKHISRFTRKEIDHLFASCTAVYKSKELVILTAPCLLDTGRVLLITSRKVGNAPERNKLRRQGRAIYYEERLFSLQKDCIAIFKAPAVKLSFEQLKSIFIQALQRHVEKKADTPSASTNA